MRVKVSGGTRPGMRSASHSVTGPALMPSMAMNSDAKRNPLR
jgi:hypothetical protein